MREIQLMIRGRQMTGGRQMTDRRSLSGSLNVTAGSGIRDSEGGVTISRGFEYLFIQG